MLGLPSATTEAKPASIIDMRDKFIAALKGAMDRKSGGFQVRLQQAKIRWRKP
jgi:hypothetical protein